LVLEIEGFDAGFGGFGFVEMLIDGRRLLLAETNEVDDVREDLDEPVVGRFEEVRKRKVRDSALESPAPPSGTPVVWGRRSMARMRGTLSYLDEQSPQRHIKPQQIPRVGGDDLDVLPAHVLRRGAHGRLHRLARRVHQELCKPFEDLLDLLRVRPLQILGRELHADVADTSGDFMIWLSLGC
jgi:hypothetical protein